jgi:hypothetical protein
LDFNNQACQNDILVIVHILKQFIVSPFSSILEESARSKPTVRASLMRAVKSSHGTNDVRSAELAVITWSEHSTVIVAVLEDDDDDDADDDDDGNHDDHDDDDGDDDDDDDDDDDEDERAGDDDDDDDEGSPQSVSPSSSPSSSNSKSSVSYIRAPWAC